MKKNLITLALMLTTLSGPAMMAQNTLGNDSVLVDTTMVDEVEAFSDTTQTDTSGVVSTTTKSVNLADEWFDDDGNFSFHAIMKDMGSETIMGMIFALVVLLLLFVIAPVIIIGLILYFIMKNRRDRMRLAEMAMKNGQPIPDAALSPQPTEQPNDELWQRGVRQSFLGVGLVVLLGYMIGKVGVGVGLLVLCIGLGNLMIARREQQKKNDNNQLNETEL